LPLDLLSALLQQGVHPWEHPLPEEEQQDEERDRRHHQFGGLRVDVRLVVALCREEHECAAEHPIPSQMMNENAMPNRASASISPMPMNIVVRTWPAYSGSR